LGLGRGGARGRALPSAGTMAQKVRRHDNPVLWGRVWLGAGVGCGVGFEVGVRAGGL
jgi:hypothetical protein